MSVRLNRLAGQQRLWSALLVISITVVGALVGFAGSGSASEAGPAALPQAGPAAVSGGGAAAGAVVVTSVEACPASNALCLFDGPDFTGERFAVVSAVPGGTCVSLVDHGWGDRARSAINTHHNSAAMFVNDGCSGGPYQVPGNSQLPSFGAFLPKSVWVSYWLG